MKVNLNRVGRRFGTGVLIVALLGPTTTRAGLPALDAYNIGRYHVANGDYGSAIRSFNEALRTSPNYPAAYLGRARAYIKCGQPHLAVDDLNILIKLSPKSAEAYTTRGVALASMQRYHEALADLSKALALDNHHAEAFLRRSQIYASMGQIDHVDADLKQALAIDPFIEQREVASMVVPVRHDPVAAIPYQAPASEGSSLELTPEGGGDAEENRPAGSRPQFEMPRYPTQASKSSRGANSPAAPSAAPEQAALPEVAASQPAQPTIEALPSMATQRPAVAASPAPATPMIAPTVAAPTVAAPYVTAPAAVAPIVVAPVATAPASPSEVATQAPAIPVASAPTASVPSNVATDKPASIASIEVLPPPQNAPLASATDVSRKTNLLPTRRYPAPQMSSGSVASSDPSTRARQCLARGVQMKQQGSWAAACAELTAALALDPKLSEAYGHRAWTYLQAGRARQALDDFSAQLRLDPENASAYLGRAQAYASIEHLDAALDDARQARRLNPKLPEAAEFCLELEHELSRMEGQRTQATSVQVDSVEAGPLAQTIDVSARLPQAAPGSMADQYCARGTADLKAGLPERAVANYGVALQLEPKLHEALFGRGRAYLALRRYHEALTDLDCAIATEPTNAQLYCVRAEAFLACNARDQAINDIETALRIDPKSADARELKHRLTGESSPAAFDNSIASAAASTASDSSLALPPPAGPMAEISDETSATPSANGTSFVPFAAQQEPATAQVSQPNSVGSSTENTIEPFAPTPSVQQSTSLPVAVEPESEPAAAPQPPQPRAEMIPAKPARQATLLESSMPVESSQPAHSSTKAVNAAPTTNKAATQTPQQQQSSRRNKSSAALTAPAPTPFRLKLSQTLFKPFRSKQEAMTPHLESRPAAETRVAKAAEPVRVELPVRQVAAEEALAGANESKPGRTNPLAVEGPVRLTVDFEAARGPASLKLPATTSTSEPTSGPAAPMAARPLAAFATEQTGAAAPPADAATLRRRAEQLASQGQHDEALRDFTLAINAAPGDIENHLARAKEYTSQNNLPAAYDDLTEALRLSPENYAASMQRGYNALNQRLTARAVVDFDQAVRLNPGDAQAWMGRGLAYAQQGQTQPAIDDLSEALRLAPELTTAAEELKKLR